MSISKALMHDNQAQAMHLGLVTTKAPPSFNGFTSWFEYEDMVLDRIAFTEVEDTKRALARNN